MLPHSRLNLAMTFGEKMSEHDLAIRIKDKFKLAKKPHGYSISSRTNPAIKVATQILARKIMRKWRVDEVLTPVVSLVAQCAKGV